jgi:hypothetical protein
MWKKRTIKSIRKQSEWQIINESLSCCDDAMSIRIWFGGGGGA